MKIEDYKVGTKLQVIRNYEGENITLRCGEIIEIVNIIKDNFFAIKTQSNHTPIVVHEDILMKCCIIVVELTKRKNISKHPEDILDSIFKTVANSRDQILYANSISSKATTNRSKYKVEINFTFDNIKYIIGDFIRVKVGTSNYYGKIKEINNTTIQLTKLSSDKKKYTIELDKISEIENIG
ncbi:hypothetical protein [Clostridium perfringens]|uniref:hypothetical protein n=1 Tax=Clostridium perfringens TaxID=1502 RepID=UPI002340FEF3|nr:hypothetical protein [Clostridium perfringens]MDC4245677.1 hypothetical protein [Clostridium perfringens]